MRIPFVGGAEFAFDYPLFAIVDDEERKGLPLFRHLLTAEHPEYGAVLLLFTSRAAADHMREAAGLPQTDTLIVDDHRYMIILMEDMEIRKVDYVVFDLGAESNPAGLIARRHDTYIRLAAAPVA